MTESLRALLSGAIDYAGLFPPAGLPLEQALAKYRQHRAGPEAWMLGRFVCPAAEISQLASTFQYDQDGRLTAVVPPGDSETKYIENLATALSAGSNFPIGKSWEQTEALDPYLASVASALQSSFPISRAIDTLECRWPWDDTRSSFIGRLAKLLDAAMGQTETSKLCPLTIFFELSPLELRLPDRGDELATRWREVVRLCVQQTQAFQAKTTPSESIRTGFKFRCGGTGSGAIPPSAELAAQICACRDAGVFWKATAGLHHPFRHVDPTLGVPVHGFINLLTAAVIADVHGLDAGRVQTILEDDDPWHFRFTNEALTWRELSATVPQITAARERALRSFGSCSIDEPWQDLAVLGLV
jgi:hypothetical protein